MKIRFFLLSLAFLMVTGLYSQNNLNNYKYIIVPKKYNFLNSENQYRLNELTVFLFEKYSFLPLMEGDNYPNDLLKDRCLALRSDVYKDGGLFKTKLIVELKDCNDRVVFKTKEGESREKEYQKAYNEALRNAFKSFAPLNYKFSPKANVMVQEEVPVAKVKEQSELKIQKLKEEIQTLKEEKAAEVVQTEVKKGDKVEPPVIEPKKVVTPSTESISNILYAQAIENGYQLVDSSPKVVYRIKKTGLENVFLVENLNATIQKKGDQWILEYYEDGYLKQDVLNIKF